MVKDYLFKKPNRKPTSQVSPHQDRKYNQSSKLFEPGPTGTKELNPDSSLNFFFDKSSDDIQSSPTYSEIKTTFNVSAAKTQNVKTFDLKINGSTVSGQVDIEKNDAIYIEIERNSIDQASTIKIPAV